jgi:hypothetical protein
MTPLGTAFSRVDALKRQLYDMLTNPRDAAAMLGGRIVESGQQAQALQEQTFGDPNRPFRVTDPQAMAKLTDMLMAGPMGFAPAGTVSRLPTKTLLDKPEQVTPSTGTTTVGLQPAELSALKTRLDELNSQFATNTALPSAVREHGALMKRYKELEEELYPRKQTTPVETAIQTEQGLLDTSYRGGHTAPNREFGAQLHQLDQIFPDDIYSPQAARNYGHYGGNDPMDRQTMRLAQSLRGKPDADVTIYRAVPKDEKIKDINQGDWVTINKQYAKEHGESVLLGNYKIIEKKVKAKDIWTNADSIHEYGYDPN